MKLVFKTQDPVRLSFVEALLNGQGIGHVVLDGETASLYGGALPWIQRRVMVDDEDYAAAQRALQDGFEEAGLAMEKDERA
ncbi:putative signal transducing protein [Woodsholea maritima]|uniref:putative signal transducing protein n=1 Tax=Woodsholea maritima TaxID=240237 RepID=UPI000360B04C|nr:DUF2007 domain-containing protein [Woodsholea maritima]